MQKQLSDLQQAEALGYILQTAGNQYLKAYQSGCGRNQGYAVEGAIYKTTIIPKADGDTMIRMEFKQS